MIKDGLFTRFPKPDFVLAIHDSADQPVGQVGYAPGYALAAADSVDITIYGVGGHGGRPQNTIDPVEIAARTVLALQTAAKPARCLGHAQGISKADGNLKMASIVRN